MEHKLSHVKPSVDTLCVYIEHLASKFKADKAVKNYFSAVRLLHKYRDWPTDNLDSFQVELMLRALPITMRHVPRKSAQMTPAILRNLCGLAADLGALGSMLQFAFLISFYGFLRSSNVCPRTTRSFDPSRHTCRGDVVGRDPGLVIRLNGLKHCSMPALMRFPFLRSLTHFSTQWQLTRLWSPKYHPPLAPAAPAARGRYSNVQCAHQVSEINDKRDRA